MNRNGTGNRVPMPQPVTGKTDPSRMQKELVRL